MNPNFCSTVCHESAFLESLACLRLSKGPHCASDQPGASLMECVQRALPGVDVASIFDGLLNNRQHESIDFTCREIYRKGVAVDFGIHKSLLEPNQQSAVGLLCAISKILSVDFFVVCGLLPLKSIRGERKVIKFSFSDIPSPKCVIVGLFGMSTFHNITQVEPDSFSWNCLNQEAIIFGMHELFEGAALVAETSQESSIEPTSASREDDLLSDEDELETLQDSDTMQAITVDDSTTVRDFIDKFYSPAPSSGISENEETIYNYSKRIDFVASQIQELHENPIQSYRQIYDIDGFYGIYQWTNSKIFKGNAKILVHPSLNCKREYNTFADISKDIGINIGNNVIFVKVADIVTNFGHIDYFFAAPITHTNGTNLSEERLRELVNESFRFATEAQCIDPVSKNVIHPGCRFHQVRPNIDAHRSSSKAKKRAHQFECKRFSCFCFHFHVHLYQKLFLEGLRLSDPYAYVQMVGTKATLFAKSLNELVASVGQIAECFDLNKMKSFFDFSISTIAVLRDSSQKVTIQTFT